VRQAAGVWSLYARSDTPEDFADSIAGGWRLTLDVLRLTTSPPPTSPMNLLLVGVRTSITDAVGNQWDEKPDQSGAQPLKFSFQTA